MRTMRFLFVVCLLSIPLASRAQKIPEGYFAQEGTNGLNQLKADLDSDGKADFVAIISDKYQTYVYISLQDGKKTLMSKNAPTCCSYLEMSKNVLILHSTGMRAFTTWRFRYDPKAGDMRLIGMDAESFGTATHDGAGTSSLNLLNNSFVAKYKVWNAKKKKLVALPVVKKKLDIDGRVLLSQFGEDTDELLLDAMHKSLPKEVQ